MSNNYEEELYHYGKLGMRWGIRRRAQRIIKDTPNRIGSEKEQRRARVNKTLAGEKYQDRFLKAVKEVDRLYQSKSPNDKHLKRWVDVAWDG